MQPFTKKKRCTACRKSKPLEEFNCRYAKHRGKSYYVNPCKKCHNQRSAAATRAFRATPEGAVKTRAYKKDWRQRNPDKVKRENRASGLRKSYNMSIAEYDALFFKQKGLCAICKQPPGSRRLHVDHDHETNAVRGLLCHNCNVALGHFGDSISRLKASIKYLKRYGAHG